MINCCVLVCNNTSIGHKQQPLKFDNTTILQTCCGSRNFHPLKAHRVPRYFAVVYVGFWESFVKLFELLIYKYFTWIKVIEYCYGWLLNLVCICSSIVPEYLIFYKNLYNLLHMISFSSFWSIQWIQFLIAI